MACGDPPLWWPGPMHVIDYGQYNAQPWPSVPLVKPLRQPIQHIVCPCNTISDFPQRCPYHAPAETVTTWRPTTTTQPNVSPYRFTPYVPPRRRGVPPRWWR